MTLNLGVVMDPIQDIKFKKDSTLALLLEAQKRGYELYYMEVGDLYAIHGKCHARVKGLTVQNDEKNWFSFKENDDIDVSILDIILMRKDPPFNMEYIYSTYLLELAKAQGVMVVNDPQALRDVNEKCFINFFPEVTPTTLVSSDKDKIKSFITEYKDVVVKPLDSMGGQSIFHLKEGDANANVVIETVTNNFTKHIMVQQFIADIDKGDKRVLLVNGKPISHVLARIPAKDDFRGNLASGATYKVQEISDREKWICEKVGPVLKDKGLLFVGLDIIGDYLTEINVTSPTCIKELDSSLEKPVATLFFNCIEKIKSD